MGYEEEIRILKEEIEKRDRIIVNLQQALEFAKFNLGLEDKDDVSETR